MIDWLPLIAVMSLQLRLLPKDTGADEQGPEILPGDALLLESGDFLLLENGDKLLLEA